MIINTIRYIVVTLKSHFRDQCLTFFMVYLHADFSSFSYKYNKNNHAFVYLVKYIN